MELKFNPEERTEEEVPPDGEEPAEVENRRRESSDSDDCPSVSGSDVQLLQNEAFPSCSRTVGKTKEVVASLKLKEEEEVQEERGYQAEILELAKERNVIVCLPTGTGKTLIAIKLAQYFLQLQEHIEKDKKKKVIFLAGTVILVHQQATQFATRLVNTAVGADNIVRAITGDLNVDVWSKQEWNTILNDYDILVISTDILYKAITSSLVKWNKIALLVLDECHHSTGDHSMRKLMKEYKLQKGNGNTELPRVLGLTATIINSGDSSSVRMAMDIEKLEGTLSCKAVTTVKYEEEVRQYATTNEMKIEVFEEDYDGFSDPCCEDIRNFIKLLNNLPPDFVSKSEIDIVKKVNHHTLAREDQLYGQKKGVLSKLISFMEKILEMYSDLGPYCTVSVAILRGITILHWIEKVKNVDRHTAKEDHENNVIALLERVHTILHQFIKKLNDAMLKKFRESETSESDFEVFKVRKCISNKIRTLLDIIRTKRPSQGEDENNPLCGIIFCQLRFTAQVIKFYLEDVARLCPEYFGFVKPEVILGQSTFVEDTRISQMTMRQQLEKIQRFRDKEVNLLVATQVLEEGIDVPACNLVVRFDEIQNYPSYVQSMGRARKTGAICYALIKKSLEKEKRAQIEKFNVYNVMLSEALSKKTLHVGEDRDEMVDRNEVEDDLIPPFCPVVGGPKITATQAIPVVNNYCQALSWDRLGSLVPTAWCKTIPGDNGLRYRAYVQLPVFSPTQGEENIFEGELMPSKKFAKRSAFMKVCEKLWEANELADNFLPKPRNIDSYKCEFLDSLKLKLEIEKESTDKKIGGRKRVQWYGKAIPKLIQESKLIPNLPASVYRIEITVTKYNGHAEHRKLYDFERQGLIYGIVTSANLDNIPSFSLRASYGHLSVSLIRCNFQPSLTLEQIGLLESFQRFLWYSVFEINHPNCIPDTRRPLMITPLRIDVNNEKETVYRFDWNLVSNLKDFDREAFLAPPIIQQRKEITFNPDSYQNAVVTPWFKTVGSAWEVFCALGVQEGSSALSKFPDSKKAETYQEYFEKKAEHREKLYHPELPLVQVKALGRQTNFLERRKDRKAPSSEKNSSNTLSYPPELMKIFPFPASLFIQGRFLPSIIHRTYRLLISAELRAEVATYFKWEIGKITEVEPLLDEDDLIVSRQVGDLSMNEEEGNNSIVVDESLPVTDSSSPDSSVASGTVEDKNKRGKGKVTFIESTNPQLITWETVHKTIRQPHRRRDQNFALPEPPVHRSILQGLQRDALNSISFPRFDNETEMTALNVPSMNILMEALTLKKSGDCFNLEKLEVMGDSVLKLVASLHIFQNFRHWDEGKMTLLRMKLISNQHLYQLGKKRSIGELLSGSFFFPGETWLPPLLSPLCTVKRLKSETGNSKTTFTDSHIDDKSVADAVEAIIGAYYMTGGLDGAFKIMEWLGLRGPLKDGSEVPYSRATTMKEQPETSGQKRGTGTLLFLEENLENVLDYKFKEKSLALEALTHPTEVNRTTDSYERLEFVGDAILDFLVTTYILHNTKITDPGKVTDLRSALVNNVTFASLAVRWGFHCSLQFDSKLLGNCIKEFAYHQDKNGYEVTDPCKLWSDFECLTVQEIEVPKVLGDIFESIAGAVFVDSGMSIDEVWRVFYPLMKKEIDLFTKNTPLNPLRELYETYSGRVEFTKITDDEGSAQESNKDLLRFQKVSLKIRGELIGGRNLIHGVGANVKQAKQAAAKYAVRRLKELKKQK